MRTTDNACVRTAHTLHLGFKVCASAGKVCGTATHAVGGDAGYGLLHLGFKVCTIRRWGVWRSHKRGWRGCRLRLAKSFQMTFEVF
ncbi:hypothetical protein ACTHUE_06415 [Neisseria sp. P0021.S005]